MIDYIFPTNIKFTSNSCQNEYFNTYLKKYFTLEELFSEKLINLYDNNCLQFVKLDLLKTLFLLREYFNVPIYINNWKNVKDKKLSVESFSNRLVRFPNLSYYSPGSRHSVIIDSSGNISKLCDAVDFDVKGKTAEEVREIIKKNKDIEAFKMIMRLEDGVNWVHADLMKVNSRIFEFKV